RRSSTGIDRTVGRFCSSRVAARNSAESRKRNLRSVAVGRSTLGSLPRSPFCPWRGPACPRNNRIDLMCGIAGILARNSALSEHAIVDAVARMVEQILHRGPDDGGVRVVGRAGLGHRRLAIIDLNPRSSQPMGLADGSVWTVFNGEIYNFPELRRQL